MNNKDKQVERHIQELNKHNRKKKLRDLRRKTSQRNEVKKPRLKKISTATWDDWDDLDEMAMESFVPIQSQSERERRKQIEKMVSNNESVGDEKASVGKSSGGKSQGENQPSQGLVVEAGSGMCRVDLDEELLLCEIRGNIKDTQTGYVNVVAVGDRVTVRQNGGGRGIVEEILPRRSVLSRPYSPDQGVITDLKQIIAANVETLLIVASWREPYIWPALIDRYLITAQRNHIDPIVCVNKTDLIEDQSDFDAMVEIYSSLGNSVIKSSVVTGEGIDKLRDIFKDSVVALAGLSGVGKSSLLNAVQPSMEIKTGHVSERGLFTGQGRHTTTHTRLWKLDHGGVVIDTPGVRSFGLAGIQPSELAGWYPEMVPHLDKCRYSNCTHINEPNCGVKEALESGSITGLRYKNYRQLFEELSS